LLTDHDIAAYKSWYAAQQVRPGRSSAKRGRGRPRKSDTDDDEQVRLACSHVRWIMEMDDEDPLLHDYVEEWLLSTRLSPCNVWETDLNTEDWAKVSGPNTDFSRPLERKIVRKLVRRRLASQAVKLETALHLAAHMAGLALEEVETLRGYREKGSATERRRRARGE